MSTQKYILAIDLGTSGPKVGLCTTGGVITGHEFEPVALLLQAHGGAEQEPEAWWQTIVTATHRLLDQGLAPAEDIIAISVTSQWSGTVAVDKDGVPLMNAIIWMDTRGAPYADAITRGPLAMDGYAISKALTWIRISGGVPGKAGKDPLAHLL